MNENKRSTVDRRVGVQRLALFWEGLWPALHWPLMVLALAAALVSSGLLQRLTDGTRLTVLAILGLLFLASLRSLLGLVRPTRLQAMRRMEQAAAMAHRVLSSADDKAARELSAPEFAAVWEEHTRRQLAKLDQIPLSPPRSAWRNFDPRALRVPAALLLLVSLFLGSGDFRSNLSEAARLSPPVAVKPLTLDAWLKPPGYTGKPPLLLTGDSMREALARGDDIRVPENSLFTARISGAAKPSLQVLDTTDKPLADMGAVAKVAEDTLSAEVKLTRPVTLLLKDGETELARYPVTIIPDEAPQVSLTKEPLGEGRGTLVTDWEVKDDYGVKSLTGEISLADEQDGGIGFESNGVFLFTAPQVKFSLRRPNAKAEKGTTTHDLAAHPWAGLRVMLQLTAKDAAGQEGRSSETTFTLPERLFVRPMAQALIEQRKQLILFPEKARAIGDVLNTLMIYPNGLVDRSGQVIAISAVGSRLKNAAGYDDVKLAVAELWDIAVAIDEGSLEDARAELQALRKELEKALQDGAPPERIAELMDKMRKAMDKFMEAMREETERRMRDGTLPRQSQQGRMITREDLQKMLDALEDMAKGGSKDAAQQLLSELDRMLQNMQPGMAQQGQADGEMSEMMDQLGEMMRRQQGLMDETQRQPGPGEQGQDGDRGQMGGQGLQGEEGNRGRGMGGLADRQRALQEMLDQLMQGGQGQLPGELGDASEAMRGAEEALRGGDREGALRDQGEALDNLRRGAGKLAQQLRENGQGQAEGQARDGEGRGGRDDPLGRPRATRNPDTGPDRDMLPSETAIKRAREILETLRSKSNERGLTDGERSYIERLLRGLY